MAQITITEALAELKTIGKRVEGVKDPLEKSTEGGPIILQAIVLNC